jgi:hypothetical protein
MSLPTFSTQSELFSTASLSSHLFAQSDRYRLFAKLVYPPLAKARAALEKCYCLENGRAAIEPVLMLGVSILQDLDGVPDREAVEMLRYHAGWNFALKRQLGDEVFHPSSLVNFRNRLLQHDQSALGFKTILDALVEAGLVSRQSRQRLDSTQMFGRVARMGRLDCVRETLRMALKELEERTSVEVRPKFWAGLWERYVDSPVDYRASAETLGRKLAEAGSDCWLVLQWLSEPVQAEQAAGVQAQLLKRVFGEQFEVVAGSPTPLPQEKTAVVAEAALGLSEQEQAVNESAAPAPELILAAGENQREPSKEPELNGLVIKGPAQLKSKDKGQFSSDRVQNPHDPDATYATKGQGEQKKEQIGYKVQVAETVQEGTLAAGEPTRNFLVGIVTHPAYESDELGAEKMEKEQASMGLEKPPVQYVDAAYISAKKLVEVQAEGRELIGPAQCSGRKDGRFIAAEFDINVEGRRGVCPAGKISTQCSRLEEKSTGKVSFRFEWSTTDCQDCPLRSQCLGKDQRHRTLVVGEHHTALQARRKEEQTDAFQQKMKHRNAIEGTQSELVRGHGLRRARSGGLSKVRLQNYFSGAACNVKRWIRREIWKLSQRVSTTAAEIESMAVS